jgi:hypothetical protein
VIGTVPESEPPTVAAESTWRVGVLFVRFSLAATAVNRIDANKPDVKPKPTVAPFATPIVTGLVTNVRRLTIERNRSEIAATAFPV